MHWAKLVLCLMVAGLHLTAAVDGVVMNATTGKPQPSVVVNLVQPSQTGMKTLASVKSDSEGKFKIDKEVPPGPALLQGLHQGATYNLLLAPGAPATGLRLNVYDSTSNPKAASLSQHMVLIEPSATALQIGETFLYGNETKTTFQDPAKGSLQFFLPEAAGSQVNVTIDAPGGMPIQRPAEKTAQPGVYKVNYPLKPGQTRFDIRYAVPAAATFSGRILHAEGVTRLVTPSGVTLTGDGVDSLGQEPQTKAHIYNVTGSEYEVAITGTGSLRDAEANASPSDEDNGEPRLEEQPARVYTRLWWVLGLAFGILGLGGFMLYRRGRV